MIKITPDISIPEAELREAFIRSSGPGGQNINKVATAVQLRFDVRNSPSLPEHVRQRLIRLAGKRLTEDGVLIIEAKRFRAREQNRKDALERLIQMIRKASKRIRPRRRTKPTLASKQRRLDSKKQRSRLKKTRKRVRGEGER